MAAGRFYRMLNLSNTQYLQCGFLHSLDVQFISAFPTVERGHSSFKRAFIFGSHQGLRDENNVVRGYLRGLKHGSDQPRRLA